MKYPVLQIVEARDSPLLQSVISVQPPYHHHHHQLADSQIVRRPVLLSYVFLLFFFIICNVLFGSAQSFLIPPLYQYSLSIILESISFSVSSPTLLHPPPVIFAFSILPLLCCTALLFLCCLFFALSSSFPVHCSSHLLIFVPSFISLSSFFHPTIPSPSPLLCLFPSFQSSSLCLPFLLSSIVWHSL